MGLIERRELAAERRGSVRRRPRAGPEGPVLRRWHPCRRPCGAANGRAPAARSLAFGVWGVLHFRECWRRLGGGGPVRGAGVFGTLICTHEPWYGGEKEAGVFCCSILGRHHCCARQHVESASLLAQPNTRSAKYLHSLSWSGWVSPDTVPRMETVQSDVSTARSRAGLTRFLIKSVGSSVQPRTEKRPASRHTCPSSLR